MSAARRLVLVGAGHAHVDVLRRWALRPVSGVELVLVVDRSPAIYSGMVPGFVAGQYRESELAIDAAQLARRAGALVVLDAASRIDALRRSIRTKSGATICYEIATLDVGSTVLGRDLPGVAENALSARPIQGLIAGVPDLVARAGSPVDGTPFHLVVVGAGAGGVELAFCLAARLRRARPDVRVTILDRGKDLLPGRPPRLAMRVTRAARLRGIAFRGDSAVVALEGTNLRLACGEKAEADAVVWVPGPAAHAFLRDSGLPVDPRGFVRIRPTLQVEGHESLFAVGDCAALPTMQKAGVYAVRAAPVLDANLRFALAGRPLRTYRPQSEFLSLLNLGDGSAIGSKRGLTFEGRWVMRLKDRIDRHFMERFR